MRKEWSLSSAGLHILAMLFMVCDHSWHALFPAHRWLTCVGRIAFPIFAFMIAEGFFRTHDLKKYMQRILIFALISEIPFDMFYDGIPFYPFHQNVMWGFLIALLCMAVIEKIRKKGKLFLTLIVSLIMVLVGFILGMALFVDFYGFGILMVFTFYFFHVSEGEKEIRLSGFLKPLEPAGQFIYDHRKIVCFLGQLFCLYQINVEMLSGMYYPVTILGFELEIVEQGLALLALIPIWLYKGRQGYHSKGFRYFCYAFYPAHLAILYLAGWISTML